MNRGRPSPMVAFLRKPVLLILGGILFVPVALFAAIWIFTNASYTPSKIVDFHPTDFPARAEQGFFYSIGNEMKYGDHIDPQSRTLCRGEVRSFLVSPDQRKIALAGNGRIAIASLDATAFRQVTPADSIYREPKPIGQTFFRDDHFQWSKDSNSLYLIKDEYYESKGSQLFSSKGELWKYDLKTSTLQFVLKPFPAENYFFDAHSRIYFSEPTASGDLILKRFDGRHVEEVPTETVATIPTSRLAGNVAIESPFFSFESFDYPRFGKGIHLDTDSSGQQTLANDGKTYLAFSKGEGFKGSYYCSDPSHSLLLPGERYYLFSVSCQNYDGQLLIDTQTGKYRILPKDTRAYLTLNTDTHPHYHIGGGGISIR